MIKKGDNVIVLTGSSKGKTGKVHEVLREHGLAVVEGLNLRKRHERARKSGQKGQIIERAMPIHLSNIALVEDGKPIRLGKKKVGEKWIRVSRKSGKEI